MPALRRHVTVYRVFVDIKDPEGILKTTDLHSIVQGVLDSAKVEVTPALKKQHVTVEACTPDNSNNAGINRPGWHAHDGVSQGCNVCKQGFADHVA